MLVALEGNLRFRMSAELKERWSAACDARKISQQDAITSLLEFFVAQDGMVQAAILGQIPLRNDTIELAIRAVARQRREGQK